MNETEPILNGICCDVCNCVYNNGCNCCTANEVHVKTRSEKPEETMCETFHEV